MNGHYRHHSTSSYQGPKKIKNFTYLPEDRIGKGYSSVVYKGKNELTSNPQNIQMRQWLLRRLR